jgi:hypothetical protein
MRTVLLRQPSALFWATAAIALFLTGPFSILPATTAYTLGYDDDDLTPSSSSDDEDSSVVKLTVENFYQATLGKTVFVKFYDPM